MIFKKITLGFQKLTTTIMPDSVKNLLLKLDLIEIIKKEDEVAINFSKLNQVNCLMSLVFQLNEVYAKFYETNWLFTNFLSLHTYFVYIKNLIEEQKIILKDEKSVVLFKNRLFTDQLTDMIINLIKMNAWFCKFLLNNGVSEFNTDEGISQQNNEAISG